MGKQKRFRICSKCHKKLPLDSFHKDKNRKHSRGYICKKCISEYKKGLYYKYHKEHLEYSRRYYLKTKNSKSKKLKQRDYHLRKKYGITLNDYNKLSKQQHYKCAICSKEQKDLKYSLNVDHDHRTGKIRGLLCIRCNYYIMGMMKDNKEIFKGVIKYLTKILKEVENE